MAVMWCHPPVVFVEFLIPLTSLIWVCLKMVYTPNYSHLVGIMISKTIGFGGTLFSDTPIYLPEVLVIGVISSNFAGAIDLGKVVRDLTANSLSNHV